MFHMLNSQRVPSARSRDRPGFGLKLLLYMKCDFRLKYVIYTDIYIYVCVYICIYIILYLIIYQSMDGYP